MYYRYVIPRRVFVNAFEAGPTSTVWVHTTEPIRRPKRVVEPTRREPQKQQTKKNGVSYRERHRKARHERTK